MHEATHEFLDLDGKILKTLKLLVARPGVFALIVWAFYRRQQRFYIPHLYYSVHFHAFAFLVMSVYLLVNRAGVPKPAAAVLILAVIPYHFLALRRVYGGSLGRTLTKGLAAGFLYWLTAIVSVLVLTFAILVNL